MRKEIKISNTNKDIEEVCQEVAQLLIEKNASYGDSALNPIRVFSRADSVEGLKVRIDDKLSRLAQGNYHTHKDTEDTELDLLGYLVLLRIARKRRS